MGKQTELIKYWEKQGYFVINLVRITPIGLPDLLCLKKDSVIFVESKEVWDLIRPLQRIWHKRLKKLGFEIYVNYDKQ